MIILSMNIKILIYCSVLKDLLFFLDSTLCYRLPMLGWFADFYRWLPRWSLAAIFYGTPVLFHADNLATMFMLLNRLTSVAWPIAHRKVGGETKRNSKLWS
jgi:hypothetical protein